MTYRSKYLNEFVKEITYNNRNPKDIKVLDMLNDRRSNPEIILPKNEIIYRARVITDGNRKNIGKMAGFYGFGPEDSYVPPKEYTRDMRANYRYIPYLYCANHAYLSLVEVRPRFGAEVSIASIRVNDDIRLLDFTMHGVPEKKMMDPKKNLFRDLSKLYSVPVTDDDSIIDYIPTQFIAEYTKNLGYDGIAFLSSLTPEYNEPKYHFYNIVVFNYHKAEPIKSNIVKVVENILSINQIDADKQKLDVVSLMEKLLREI